MSIHQSIATIDSPEFINLAPLEINPLMSSCEIKVLYIGENRNESFITKEVANEMAKTLRGAPIVGYYKDEKSDFADHGEKIVIDDEGIKFQCMTKPYGFVAPDAKVWFQKFEDTDEFGNVETREYLMTTGYLWTGQYEECKLAVEEGRPQSMELDGENLDGYWATNDKTGMDFFIINDAIFSKLCILGDDVEPCFEGSSITAPLVSKTFTKMDDTFKKTLYTMMQDLKFALEGGQKMMAEETEQEVETLETEKVAEEQQQSAVAVEEEQENVEEKVENVEEEEVENMDNVEQVDSTENDISIEADVNNVETFEKNDDEVEEVKEEEKEDVKDYSLLENKFNDLQTAYNELETKYQALVEFKTQIDTEKKDALINSFYMLSEEDKADVIANKMNYSLEDIEAKLSVICVRKKVNFDLKEEAEDTTITTYTLNDNEQSTVPAIVAALKATRDSRK